MRFEEIKVGDIVETMYHPMGFMSPQMAEVVYVSPTEILVYNKDWDRVGAGHNGRSYTYAGNGCAAGHWHIMSGDSIVSVIGSKQLNSVESLEEYEGLFE